LKGGAPRLVVVAAGLAVAFSSPASAQVTVSPNPADAGSVVSLSSEGLFGNALGAVSLVNSKFPAYAKAEIVLWNPGTITVKLSPDTANGCYDVRVLLGDSRQLSSSECLSVVLRPRLLSATTEDPCARKVTLQLNGRGFSSGTEIRVRSGPNGEPFWEHGKTFVEPEAGYRPEAKPYRQGMTIRIRSTTVMEAELSRCFVLDPAASMKVLFPDGSEARRGVGPAYALPTPELSFESPKPALYSVIAPDVCHDTVRLRLSGIQFVPGTEVPTHPGRPASRTWRPGLTVVETGETASDPAEPHGQGMAVRIRSTTLIEVEVDLCFVLRYDAMVRIWFPDGSKSEWSPLRIERETP